MHRPVSISSEESRVNRSALEVCHTADQLAVLARRGSLPLLDAAVGVWDGQEQRGCRHSDFGAHGMGGFSSERVPWGLLRHQARPAWGGAGVLKALCMFWPGQARQSENRAAQIVLLGLCGQCASVSACRRFTGPSPRKVSPSRWFSVTHSATQCLGRTQDPCEPHATAALSSPSPAPLQRAQTGAASATRQTKHRTSRQHIHPQK